MPRIYKRKTDALVAKLSVPMSEDLLRRLRAHAETKDQTPTAAAREMIERSIPASVK